MVKINTINSYYPVGFKNALTKKSEKNSTKANGTATISFLDFETFRKTIASKYLNDISINSNQFEDRKYYLKNNLKVSIAKMPIYNDGTIEGKILITPKGIDTDSLKLKILAEMMNVAAKNNYQDNNFIKIYSIKMSIAAIFSSNKDNIDKCLNDFVGFVTNPILSESTLEYAKDTEKEYLNSPKYGGEIAEDYLLNRNRLATIEDVDKIQLDDIKKLYFELFANSQADIAICAASNFSDETSMLNILSKMPSFTPFDEQYFTRSTKPLTENKTFYGNVADKPSYSKYFILENDSKFKNELIGKILYDYYIKIMQRDFKDDSMQFGANYITDETISIIRFDVWSKTNQGDLDKFKQIVSTGIEKLINDKMTENMLSEIKMEKKSSIIKDFTTGFTRMNNALSRYKDTDSSLKSQLKILDSITTDDIQNMAKRSFSGYYVEANN